MGCKRLDIYTISAKNLKDVNHFSKMGVYAILSIQSDSNNGNNSLEQRTTYDENGGKNPVWVLAPPKMFTFNVFTDPGQTLVIKLKTKGSLKFEKDVGEVRVPIMHLMENYGDAKDEKRMSFGVTTPGGRSKGELEFSFKLVDVMTCPSGDVAAAPLFPTGGGGVEGAYQHPPAPGYGSYQYHAPGGWNPQAGYGYTPLPPPPPPQNSFIQGMLPAVADGAVMGLVKGSASAVIDAIVNGSNN